MENLEVISDGRVMEKINSYPARAREKLLTLREMIFDVARTIADLGTLEETLKWNEPSYLTGKGSTLRMDWKERSPETVALYFQCTSKLVDTFKELYGEVFTYEKNRALIFRIDQEFPLTEIKACIAMTLTYHAIKHLPLLGN